MDEMYLCRLEHCRASEERIYTRVLVRSNNRQPWPIGQNFDVLHNVSLKRQLRNPTIGHYCHFGSDNSVVGIGGGVVSYSLYSDDHSSSLSTRFRQPSPNCDN